MTTKTAAAPALTDEQFAEVLELIADADTVELKLTVPEQQRSATHEALGLDPLEAHLRQVFFFDTPDLDLDRAGVVVRARRIQHDLDDTVVKLRPVTPSDLPRGLRKTKGFGVEVDAMPGGYVCSASFKGELGTTEVRECAGGRRPIRKLFSKAQREFYGEHAPDGLELDDLEILGPVHVLKLKFEPEDFGRKLVAEAWLYPDGSRILELSLKCRPRETLAVSAHSRGYLLARGVDLSGAQQTKTRTALEYFAKNL